MSLTARIKAEARRLGFDLVGVLPAGPSQTHPFYKDWLAKGYAGEMAYLERHAVPKADLRNLAPGARSAVFLAVNYNTLPPEPGPAPYQGRISRYAWGRDYHDGLKDMLNALAHFVEREAEEPVRSWSFVDSAPVMEREFAARAGLGWVGKHGVLINWEQGSWLFVAELLLDIELQYDRPETAQAEGRASLDGLIESCGSCTACIEACPTNAIVANKTVDSRRCISYHTIELKGPVPEEFRPQIGEWVFGCDICQDVCPWNRRAPVTTNPSFSGDRERATPDLLRLLALNEQEFRKEYGGSALMRPKRKGLLRNAAIALGNRLAELRGKEAALPEGHQDAVAALESCLKDTEPLIRGAAAWALGRAGAQTAREALANAMKREQDGAAYGEMAQAEKTILQTPPQP